MERAARGFLSSVVEWLTVAISALPAFWLGFLLVFLFAIQVRLFPATGYVPPTESIGGWLWSLVLPVTTIVVVPLMGIARQTRDSMQEAMSRDFVAALRADGISELRIIWRHALRAAAIPVITLVGVYIVGMLGGSVFAESVFALNGLGNLVVSSSQKGDLPVVLGVVMVICLGVVVVNLLIELCYGWLNPKVRRA